METKILQRSISMIGYRYNKRELEKRLLLKPDFNLLKEIIKPFKRELKKNLLEASSLEKRNEILSDYLFQFLKFQDFYKEHHELFSKGSLRNSSDSNFVYTDEVGKERILEEMENYAVFSRNAYDMLLNEMQLACLKFKINFLEICHELNFSKNYFDSSVTHFFDA